MHVSNFKKLSEILESLKILSKIFCVFYCFRLLFARISLKAGCASALTLTQP